METENYKVFIIDDEESVRRSFSLLLNSAGYAVESFAGTEEFLAQENYQGEGCILLDIFLDGKSGLEIQEEIRDKFTHLPIIYITGFGDIPMSVQALKKGAINFLQKPVDERQLIAAVEEALKESRIIVSRISKADQIKSLIQTLTPRELEIFRLILTGKLNKQIASDLNIAEHTVKIHRGNMTKKLGVKSVAEMVHMANHMNIQ
jgi:FixJ family two-component response regulator